MNTHDLDTPCGFCEGQGYRQIADGLWLSAPECPDCGGVGFLVTSPDAERLLAFVERHIKPGVRREIDTMRTEGAAGSLSGAIPFPLVAHKTYSRDIWERALIGMCGVLAYGPRGGFSGTRWNQDP